MRIALCLLLLLVGKAAASPAPLTLERRPVPVLWDRFDIRLPVGMKLVASPRDSLGLGLPRSVSTRAELVRDDGHVVMTIADTFTVMSGDFVRAVRAELVANRVGTSAVSAVKLSNTRAVIVEPPLPRMANEPNMIAAGYIRARDGRVVVVAFYVFGSLLEDIEDWAWIARQSIESIEDNEASAHVTRHDAMVVGDRVAQLIVPDGWALHGLFANELRNVGLMVYETVELGTPARTCSIDNGGRAAPTSAPGVRMDLLGATGTWRTWRTKNRFHGEILVVVAGQSLRVACSAPSADGVSGARRIVAEMTLQ